jgi:molybdopterin synthase sulfur carrier subunit
VAVVFVPSLMRDLTGGESRVRVAASNLRELLEALEHSFPGMKARLVDEESGRVKPEIAVAVDGETEHMGLLEPLGDETEVHFIPAIGGGQGTVSG